jgi:hypothetical protein
MDGAGPVRVSNSGHRRLNLGLAQRANNTGEAPSTVGTSVRVGHERALVALCGSERIFRWNLEPAVALLERQSDPS